MGRADVPSLVRGSDIVKRKLLFVVNVDWFFLSHRLPIAQAALKQGYQVHIAAGITDRLEELRSHGLVVHPLSMSRNSVNPVGLIESLLELWRIFRAVKPDIVHLVTIKPVLLGGLVARLARIPAVVMAIPGLGFVFTARGTVGVVRRKLVGTLYRLAVGHPNIKVIFQNPDDLLIITRLTDLHISNTALIRGSGVSLDEFVVATPTPDRPVILLASRMLADKGVREFVDAARKIRSRCTYLQLSPRFVLVGEPDPSNPSSLTWDELERWEKEGVVEIWGLRSDMPAVLAAATIVVLPSYGEGLPKVLIEAAACGRAVVTTDVPGCRDAIEPGVTGILVPVRDVTALADAIQTLLANPQKCLAMGQAGRALAESAFDVRLVIDQHLAIYNGLLAGAP